VIATSGGFRGRPSLLWRPSDNGPTPSRHGTPDRSTVKHALLIRIIKMTATSGGFLAASECTKFVFGRGSAPDPAGRAYSAPPDPLAGLRWTLRGMGDEERGGDAPQ